MPKAFESVDRGALLAALPDAAAAAEKTAERYHQKSYKPYVLRAVERFRVLTAEELGELFDKLREADSFVEGLHAQGEESRIGSHNFQEAWDAVLSAYEFRVLETTLRSGVPDRHDFREWMGSLDLAAYYTNRSLGFFLGSVVSSGFGQTMRANGCKCITRSSLSVISGPDGSPNKGDDVDAMARHRRLSNPHWFIGVRWDDRMDKWAKLEELRAAVARSQLEGVVCNNITGGMYAEVPVSESKRLWMGV